MNVKIAVVGAGHWGKNLIRNFSELGCLDAICDSNEYLQPAYNDKYSEAQFLCDYNIITDDCNLDAVVLSTPAAMHFEMAKQALHKGKHVYVEKPMALSVLEGEELVRLAEQMKRVLMVGHVLQYHGAVLALKKLIDQGELGKIEYIYSNRLNFGKIRSEENILWSFAPHDISIILMLLNEMPSDVVTKGGNYLQKGISDTTVTLLRFPSGVDAHIFVSWLHPYKEQKLIVIGDRKMAVFNDTADDKLVLYPRDIRWENRVPVASKAQEELVPIDTTEPLFSACRHFVSCIKSGKSPLTDGREGVRVLRILRASQRSLNQNGESLKIGGASKKRVNNIISTSDSKPFSVHDSSYVDENVVIGENTRIWHFSRILSGSTIGKNCRIGQNVVIGPNVFVGKGCKIQNNVSVYEGVTLQDYVFCGPSAVFTNVFNPRSEIPRVNELRPTLVKKGATLGANCTIVCGITIGTYSFIGAGSVVINDVPDFALITGNPGLISGWMCKCGRKLELKSKFAVCEYCDTSYSKNGGTRIEETKELEPISKKLK
jgi:UDP-2-acetamido-3-amino-2,3-dideoxy-glucuronate N-acetyltransferase